MNGDELIKHMKSVRPIHSRVDLDGCDRVRRQLEHDMRTYTLWIDNHDIEDCDDLDMARDRAIDIAREESRTVQICDYRGEIVEEIRPEEIHNEQAEWLVDDNRQRARDINLARG